MMESEGPAVQARSTWYSEHRIVRATGIVADLTVPVVRAAVARRAVYGPAFSRLRRLCGHGRISEVERIAGDPNSMHDHGKFASHGNSGAFHAPALRYGEPPDP